MMLPKPHQLAGAEFLSVRQVAFLADDPRVGKTGTAITAADWNIARRVLVVTTASGRAVWRRAWAEWSEMPRKVQVLTPADALAKDTDVAIVGWSSVSDPRLRTELLRVDWDLLILDEAHYAKSFEAKRTQAVYGVMLPDTNVLVHASTLTLKAGATWALSGTPYPNSPADIYPFLRALAPERLTEAFGPTDVSSPEAFRARYCKIKPKKIGTGCYARWIDVILGGKNEAELAARVRGLMLRRTQSDVGINEPIYDLLPIDITAAQRRRFERDEQMSAILAAADTGTTKDLEMHLGPLRRLTGEMKVSAVVAAVSEEFECGLDKIVLMAWHSETIRQLADGLQKFGVVVIDGATSPGQRETSERAFRDCPSVRVCVGQIQAAGEAIDLSAAAELIFVESSFTPKDMRQASLRITNHTQKRQPRVRVAALAGSIDEAVQQSLLRKWSSIREVQA